MEGKMRSLGLANYPAGNWKHKPNEKHRCREAMVETL